MTTATDFNIVISTSTDPYRNLALEQNLFQQIEPGQVYFMLWQNQDSVIIGRNQNPLQEINLSYLRLHDIQLARRMTGGGTVFHDLGNLNYSFITDRAIYDETQQFGLILSALAKWQLLADLNHRKDLLLGSRKFSGNSFRFTSRQALHHGTLLVSSNLDKLQATLNPQFENIDTSAVRSNHTAVVNLCELNPVLTVARLKQSLLDTFGEIYGAADTFVIDPEDIVELDHEYLTHASDDWIYGMEL